MQQLDAEGQLMQQQQVETRLQAAMQDIKYRHEMRKVAEEKARLAPRPKPTPFIRGSSGVTKARVGNPRPACGAPACLGAG